MIDLKEYYLKNISDEKYHYRFRSYILASNKKHNIFFGEEEEKFEFLIIDEAIEKFKSLCQPEIQTFSKEQTCWFYTVLKPFTNTKKKLSFQNEFKVLEALKDINKSFKDVALDFISLVKNLS